MRKLLPLFLIFAAGCTANVPAAWVEAERARYNAISGEYKGYYDADANLSLEDRARRDRTLEAWRADLDAHEAAIAAGAGR